MNKQQTNSLFEIWVELLDLPDSAYEKAISRYEDLGEWLCRDGSTCSAFNPRVFSQGSFRLGTAIRPLDENEAYDLDLVCQLNSGITKQSHTQEAVKGLVGFELEAYRAARSIDSPVKEKHRCWRIEYADQVSFHMDILPSIPELQARRQRIKEDMEKAGTTADLASEASDLTVSITDDRHPGYPRICDNWNISNPDGYAIWFEARMRLAKESLQQTAETLKAASIDDVPVYRWKTPLQRVVQLLKRHRDRMFKDDLDVKPISIIITTLAGRAYEGESDIEDALRNVLARMESFVGTKAPRIPNPVDPDEDFADRWSRPDCAHLHLEENFWKWLEQAKADFELISRATDAESIAKQAVQKFSLNVNSGDLRTKLGLDSASVDGPKVHVITGQTAKPWRAED